MSVLDGEVPYVLAIGNHDLGTNNYAGDRFTRLNEYFSATDNSRVDPAQGGILTGTYEEDRLENAYYTFSAPDGRQMLIFSLEFGPRQGVVDWALGIASQAEYADHTAILLTHAYLYDDNTRYDWEAKGGDQDYNPHAYGIGDHPYVHDGEELWNELVKKTGTFNMTFNGHVAQIPGGDGVGYLASEDDAGHSVHQMLFNTQDLPNGGNGWMRLIEFLPGGTHAQVRTYSPWLDAYRTDSKDQFLIELSSPLLVTNTLPYAESFEWDGGAISPTNGWTMSPGGGAALSTDPDVLYALTNDYTGAFPLSTNHTQVLMGVDGEGVTNHVASTTEAMLKTDFMMMPSRWASGDNLPLDADAQLGICMDEAGRLNIMHADTTNRVSFSNEWHVLTNSPAIGTQEWVRVTLIQDYSTHRFQVQLNDTPALIDAHGWSRDAATRPGSWFYMVNRSRAHLSSFEVLNKAYCDDLTIQATSDPTSRKGTLMCIH